ncbi:hypothetical protein [Treponema sp. OMZ 855]|uniref:hypothetical protein n=1 Tax=Treponema sp. OMZ 855 TaxID=1643512 RepID=UPI0020A3AF8A|nr:hypothetical protein [Treponema sp. OMZ 855]UTC51189.1 hypothetical protein E4N65_02240 [Treponema sp. OMZ 855]
MIIKESVSVEDQINITIDMWKQTGILSKNIKKRRILLTCLIISFLVLVLILIKGYLFQSIIGVSYILWVLAEIIFAKQIYLRKLKKNLRKQYALAAEKFNLPKDKIEVITEITDGYVEAIKLGTSTKFLLKDFLFDIDNEAFYILEFTNGRFLYFKKDAFETKEQYEELLEYIKRFTKNS